MSHITRGRKEYVCYDPMPSALSDPEDLFECTHCNTEFSIISKYTKNKRKFRCPICLTECKAHRKEFIQYG